MILNTKQFQDTCKKILLAVNNDAANLELVTRNNNLFLNVTNSEYFVSVIYPLDSMIEFHAVVEAGLFLNLISSISTEEFSLDLSGNAVVVKAGKSKYSLPLIFENDSIMKLPIIKLDNATVEMNISNSILQSIVNVNSKELLKVGKNAINKNPLHDYYYIDESGCFTFTAGACLNAFTLEKPVKVLLNDRIVKLFKLFNTDIKFRFGHDTLQNGTIVAKVVFENENIYLAAIITENEELLSKMVGTFLATKNLIADGYQHKVVLSATDVSNALNRLLTFTKNSNKGGDSHMVHGRLDITGSEFIITDDYGNSETATVENGSFVSEDYTTYINLAELKLMMDSFKNEHVTLNCGNHRAIVINFGTISSLMSEANS